MNNFTIFGQGNNVPNNLIGGREGHSGSFGRDMAMSIPTTMSGHEALALAGIDWSIEASPLSDHMAAPNADTVWISQRTDNGAIVGVNGKRHNVIQNDVLAEFGDTVRQVVPEARYVQGGQKLGGKTTFLILDLGRDFDLGGGDVVKRNIMFGTHHNGGRLFGLGVNGRMMCSNQWSSFTKGSKLISIAHTASAEDRIKMAHRTLQASLAEFDEWDRALVELLNTPMRANDAFKAIAGPRPDKEGRALTEWENRIDRLWAEYSEDFNADLVGTGLGVLMAAQGVDEHRGRVKKGQRDEQRIGRLIDNKYPMAERAMKILVSV